MFHMVTQYYSNIYMIVHIIIPTSLVAKYDSLGQTMLVHVTILFYFPDNGDSYPRGDMGRMLYTTIIVL